MTFNKTKHKMTRAEAIDCFSKHMPLVQNAYRTIDFYIEAGMLEIVEEAGPGLPVGFSFNCNKKDELYGWINEFDKQGFIIVKKP